MDKLNGAFKMLRDGVDFEERIFRMECNAVNEVISALSDEY